MFKIRMSSVAFMDDGCGRCVNMLIFSFFQAIEADSK